MIQPVSSPSWPVRSAGTGGLATGRAATPSPATSFAGGSIERDVTGSMTITTREGDTVTLSASATASRSSVAVDTPGGSGRSTTLQLSRNLSITVQGDLNASERHDIARAVRTFLHDLRAAMNGRDPSVANVAGGHPKSLASVSAEIDTRTTLTLVAGGAAPSPAVPASGEPDAGGSGAPLVSDTIRAFVLPRPVNAPVVAVDAPGSGLGPAQQQAGLATGA